MAQPNGGQLTLLAGVGYRLGSEHNIHALKPFRLKASSSSKILCNLLGADKVLFDATNPVSPTTRGMRCVVEDLYIRFHSSVDPNAIGCIFFKRRYSSDLKFYGDCQFLHYRQNTMFSGSATWNNDLGSATFWGGGHRKPRKLTSGITFSITVNTTTLTSSAPIFGPEDVGDILATDNEHHKIVTYNSPTSVTTERPSTQTYTASVGTFGSIRATTSGTNSKTVFLDGPRAVASDVGRIVYVMFAVTGQGSGSPLRAHRSTIESVTDASTIVLVDAVPLQVTGTEIIFSPVVEIYRDAGAFDGQPNDIVWSGMHVEQHKGTALVIKGGVNLFFDHTKLHGNGLASVDGAASDYALIVDDASLDMHFGEFEAQSCGRLGRVLVSGAFGKVTINDMQGLATRKQSWLHTQSSSASGLVTAERWYSAAALDQGTMSRAFTKVGAGKLVSGRVSAYTVDYSQYPDVTGDRPPALILPTGQKTLVAGQGTQASGVWSTNGISAFRGFSSGSGTVEAPSAVADFSTSVRLEGWAWASNNTFVNNAYVGVINRSPSGANVAGQLAFGTRDTGGTLSDRWYIRSSGVLNPALDNVYFIGESSFRPARVYATELRPGAGETIWTSGSGTPEGVVTASVGSMYTRTDGGAGTTLYVKETGTGNTGWIAK